MKNPTGEKSRDELADYLYRKFYWRVVRFFVRSFRVSQEDAEDLAQETFTRIVEALEEYRGDAEHAYVEKVARHVGLNRVRARQTQRRGAPTIPLEGPDYRIDPAAPEDDEYAERALWRARGERLHAELERLAPRQRDCIKLLLEDKTYKQIASQLGITVGAVKSAIRDATKALKGRMGGQSPEEQ